RPERAAKTAVHAVAPWSRSPETNHRVTEDTERRIHRGRKREKSGRGNRCNRFFGPACFFFLFFSLCCFVSVSSVPLWFVPLYNTPSSNSVTSWSSRSYGSLRDASASGSNFIAFSSSAASLLYLRTGKRKPGLAPWISFRRS